MLSETPNSVHRYKDAAKTMPLFRLAWDSMNLSRNSLLPMILADSTSWEISSSSRRSARIMVPSKMVSEISQISLNLAPWHHLRVISIMSGANFYRYSSFLISMFDSIITVATLLATSRSFWNGSASSSSFGGLPSLLLSLYTRHESTAAI